MPLPAKTIETRSLSEQVYQYLCSKIINGEIDYGASINSRSLAAELGVSPMPVREALKRLHSEGLVTIKPRSTCLVKRPTQASISCAMEMREVLQVFFIEKIIAMDETPDLGRLAGIVEAMREAALESGQGPAIRRFIDLDRDFHMEICGLGNNEFAEKSFREVSLHLNTKLIYDISAPYDIPLTYEDHRRILSALEIRSLEAAALMRQHLRRSHESILKGRFFKTLG